MIFEGSIIKNELHNRLKELETKNDIKFSNTQKVLLSIEGSISAILDALYGTVSIFTIDQHFEKIDEEKSKLLHLDVGEEINYREILLHGRGKPMIYALSYIPLSRCRPEAREDIFRGKLPIGKILKKYRIESRREIDKIYIEKPNATLRELFKTDECLVSREYVVIENNEIIMWTKESFPVSFFKNDI